MNKTYCDQMSKATALAQGIRTNATVLQQRGIRLNPERLETLSNALEEAAIRQEEAEAVLKTARDKAHVLLEELKELCNETKTPIKLNFPMEKWVVFGIADKR